MGDAKRRREYAAKNGLPWPPSKDATQRAPDGARWICGGCGRRVSGREPPTLACACGKTAWNTLIVSAPAVQQPTDSEVKQATEGKDAA